MIAQVTFCALALATFAGAYTPFLNNGIHKKSQIFAVQRQNPFLTATATATLAFMLTMAAPVAAEASSKTAGQIELNAIPPTSVYVDIKDLPVVGKIFSGTYTKVADGSIANPSITIKSPKDKLAAIKGAATMGHLEFDINGLVGTHLDVDVMAGEEAGVATVRVSSPLIPKLPFKNTSNGKPSDWSIVTNMGNGKSYYFNEKTGISQLEKP